MVPAICTAQIKTSLFKSRRVDMGRGIVHLLGMDDDTLGQIVKDADGWVVRLVCTALRDRRAREPRDSIYSTMSSPERCRLAVELGFPAARVCAAAERAGCVETLRWARAAGFPFDPPACRRPASGVCAWLCAPWCPCDRLGGWRGLVCPWTCRDGRAYWRYCAFWSTVLILDCVIAWLLVGRSMPMLAAGLMANMLVMTVSHGRHVDEFEQLNAHYAAQVYF